VCCTRILFKDQRLKISSGFFSLSARAETHPVRFKVTLYVLDVVSATGTCGLYELYAAGPAGAPGAPGEKILLRDGVL
jgi:hypothetical protein